MQSQIRKQIVRVFGAGLLALLTVAGVKAAGDDAPPWLLQASKISVPTYDKEVPAVVLLHEQQVTVNQDGRITTVSTFAIRILTREGGRSALAAEFYAADAGKIRELRAWMISPLGTVKKYGKDETIDRMEDPNDIYNESRLKIIDASDQAEVGSVFGYQTTTEERSIFSQNVWAFQSRLPQIASRYTLSLPKGWTAKSVTFNYANNIAPVVNGSTYTWELHDLPPIRPEPSSPRVSSLAPRVAISFFPPGDTQSPTFKTFSNWSEVSYYLTGLHDPQSSPNDAIAEKGRQLTANAKTELEKIQAIGAYVQGIRYISIDIGMSRGNGMRPHAATEVFAKSYGDCKDKANLMRAMLKVLNIPSYPVAIFSGDPYYVRAEWASPGQFNHCIIAIKVNDETQTQTIITDPKLGRLLIFDATDDNTLVGDLPEHEQGSLALIIASELGSLMKMPVTSAESNLLDRSVEANLLADGSMEAIIREKAVGTWASGYRNEFRNLSRPEYQKAIERWIAAGGRVGKLSKFEPADDTSRGGFNLDVSLVAARYGDFMRDRFLFLKPAMVSRRDSLVLTEARRTQPVVLTSNSYTETVRVKLPAGFAVDEVPDAVKLETSFGSYATNYEVKDGQLLFTRKLIQRATTIPADQYSSVRSFFEKIRSAELSPVVLARK